MSAAGKPPSVTVIVPTFQRRELVCSALESAFAQTFQDFELIVVDDGSTDGTAEALAAYGERIRYARQENGGVAAARNAGLRLARGEIVAFLDSDDRWLPEHLEVVMRVLDQSPDSVLVTTCPSFSLNRREPVESAIAVDPLPRMFIWNFVGWPTGIAVRRRALEAVGGFDERLRVGEDNDLFLRLALEGPFALLRRRTIVRGEAPDSLWKEGRRRAAYLESWELSAKGVLEQLQRSGAPTPLLQRAAGGVRFADAIRALCEEDDEALAASLSDACRLFPELSGDPDLVIGRLRGDLPAADLAAEALLVARVAAAWPDRTSPTAVGLYLHATRLAASARRLRLATRLARNMPIRGVAFETARRGRRAAGRLRGMGGP